MKVRSRQVWAWAVVGLFASAAVAGANSSSLGVSITLSNPNVVAPPSVIITPSQEVCVSETLSAQANAQVRVVCATGRVVTVSAIPGRPFLGTNGSAFRYVFAQANHPATSSSDELDSTVGKPMTSPGSSTGTPFSDSAESSEILVSF